jgi:hypothetical protein
MLDRYTINSFAIKIPDKMEKFPVLTELHQEIVQLAASKSIAARSFTIQSLKAFCGTDVTNKKALRTMVFNTFPELQTEYQRELDNRNAYYTKLFEATIAAIAMLHHDQKKTPKKQ